MGKIREPIIVKQGNQEIFKKKEIPDPKDVGRARPKLCLAQKFQVSTRIHLKCPLEFMLFDHNFLLSTRMHPECPLEFTF